MHYSILIDRTIRVPPGQVVKTTYVPVERVKMACRDRMPVGDVGAAYNALIQAEGCAVYPTPIGYFEDDSDTFVLIDGRHAFIAMLMLGYSHILVSYLQPQ
jgi:hypothetical protein